MQQIVQSAFKQQKSEIRPPSKPEFPLEAPLLHRVILSGSLRGELGIRKLDFPGSLRQYFMR